MFSSAFVSISWRSISHKNSSCFFIVLLPPVMFIFGCSRGFVPAAVKCVLGCMFESVLQPKSAWLHVLSLRLLRFTFPVSAHSFSFNRFSGFCRHLCRYSRSYCLLYPDVLLMLLAGVAVHPSDLLPHPNAPLFVSSSFDFRHAKKAHSYS